MTIPFPPSATTDLSAYSFETLGNDGQVLLLRGRRNGDRGTILAMAPVSDEPAPGILARLEHAYSMREEFDVSFVARPRELVRHAGPCMLLLDDPGGELLEAFLGRPMETAQFLRIATGIADALGRFHGRGFIHKDIKPGNILVNAATGKVWLTGLCLVSRSPRQRPDPEPPEMIAGTLAYMAPEQTGRMNRSVDSRSDLYALGVTLYEMLTGTLPFTASDPMEWVHCHIAKEATPPSERSPEIPGPISDIVMKLLAKVPEERYQTAAGVGADLRTCLESLESRGRIEPFPLGARDISDRLLIPETLYGREREIENLLAAFDRVVVRGTAELVLVSGYSGVGKSSVVNELHKVLVPPRGLFASGKFDQYKRDIPYATLAQAFQTLLRQILGKSEAEVALWREALQEAVGINGQLIVNLIPETELIIGKQRPVRDLPPQEEESRFQTLLRRFIGVFARPEHPLALFLDDLQWLDAATLNLLRTLVTHDEVRHLLVIGAYRDNEVGPSHQLLRVLAEIGETGVPVHQIALEGLDLNDVAQLVADTVHRERKDAYPLAQLVHDKTGGNPFFVIQFIATLEDENLLVLVPGATAWAWNLDRIRAKGFTENVVDLMVAKLRRFSAKAQNAMKQLACLGDSAPVNTLVRVYEESEETLHTALWEAVRPGLVFRSEDTYSFVHDRVQEAAYALIPEAERAATHLHIGRALAARMEAAEIEEKIFEIVSQFNRGAALITSREERKRVAGLNLMAGGRARSSTAYASALVYLAAGIALLDEENFEESDSLDFALRLQQAECELLSANFAAAGRLIADLLKRAKTKVDTAAAYRLKIELHLIQSENQAAVGSALECLRLFGIEMTSHPARAELDSVLEDVWRKLDGRAVEELVDLPPVTDPEIVAALEVLCVLYAPAFFTDEILTSLHICHTIRLALEHGMTGASAHAFGLFGIMLGHFYGRYEEGYRFAELARELGKRHCLFACEAKILKALEEASVWTRPMTFAIDTIRAAFRSATESGDIPVACYACNHTVTDLLVRGDHLDNVWSETERGLAFVQAASYRDVTDVLVYQQRFVQNMRGRTTASSTFDGDGFEQLRFEEQLTPDRNQTTVCWYWIIKAKARFLFGDFEQARDALVRARPILWATHGRIQFFEYHFFSALTLAALARSPALAECREQIGMHRELLARWAGTCPATFADKHLLVMAEIARMEGRDSDAGHLYDDAIHHARENGFIQNEAIANEAAARFYVARKFETIAHAYLRNARSCYLRWGASGKVRQLDQDHPRLREESATSPLTATIGAPVEQMDLATVIKVSQAVSSEIVLERLIDKLMVIAVEHAGAVRGLLLLARSNELRIEAEATTVRDSIEVNLRGAPVTAADLPQSILRYVHRTRESVLLNDATVKNPFSDDPYIRSNRSRSILCLPLVKQTQLVGVLYFENHQSSHAFTPGRIAILNLLASQAAISLENALLYADLLDAKAHLRASERELRQASDSIPSLAWSALADGSNETFNKPWHDYTGISAENALNGGWTASYHPDDIGKVLEKWTEILVSGADGEVEARMRRFDGEYRSFLVRGKALRDESGATTRWYGTCTDIEDRKQAEKGLERSKVYLEHAQQLSHTGSVSLRASDGQIFWSEETARIYGYDPAIPPTMEMVIERVHPEDVELLRDAFARATQGGASFDFEHRLLMPDGTIKYLRNFAHAVKDQEGREEVLGAVMDITDRKRVEDELRRSEVLFAQAQRLTRTSSLRWKVSTGEIIWTDESYRLMEYPRSSTPTVQMILDRCHPDDLAFVQEMVGRSAQFGTTMDFQHRLLMPNGTIKHIHVLAQNIGLKPQDYEFVGAVTDVTEHVEAKSALEQALAEVRESEEQFRTMLATIPTLAWRTTADGSAEFFSQGWHDYTGLSLAEARGGGWSACFHPDDLEMLSNRWMKIVASGKPSEVEARFRRYDGEYRWQLMRSAPLLNDQGKVMNWYGTNTDIDDLKRAETLLAGEKRLFEMIATGHSLSEALNALCLIVEELSEGSITSILLLDEDGRHLRHGAAPSLPASYLEAIDGGLIGSNVGSCGTAAYLGTKVFVSDIATDPLWTGHAELALKHDLRACFSTPILSSEAKVLGTFSIYSKQTRPIFPREDRIAEQFTHLASILIERKRAEEALKKSEALLAEGQRISQTGTWVWNLSTGRIVWSEEHCRIFGFGVDQTKVTLETFLGTVHPSDLARMQAVLDDAGRRGCEFSIEYRINLSDGSMKYIYSRGRPVVGKLGQVEEFIGTAMDISYRYEAKIELENALAKVTASEDQLRTLIDSMPGLAWTAGPNGEGEFLSQGWLNYTGMTMEEAQGPGWANAIHPDDVGLMVERWQKIIAAKKPGDQEARLRRFDGAYRWFSFRGAPLLDQWGHVVKWYGVNIDIEDQKRSEEEMRKLVALIENSSDYIGYARSPREVAYINGAWRKLAGLEADEDLAKYEMADFLPANEYRTFLEEVMPILDREGHWEGERALHNMKTKAITPVHQTIFFISEAGTGRRIGIATICRDITEDKRAEEELRRSEVALRKAQTDLAHVSRLTTMGELTASIAHEVNQPLTGIVMGGNAGLRWLDGDSPNLDEAREAIQRVVQEGKRAGAVISRIRQLFKKDDPIKEPLNINEVIEEVVVLTRNELQRHHITQQLSLATDLPPVFGDRVQVQQVLMNLILNAIEAMNAVEVGCRELSIRTLETDDNDVSVEVRDSGIGVDPQEAERIFETFHTTKPGGMGMGLAICRSIVQSHGGRLQAVPQKGPGATFQFTIPTSR